jgi:hypothetical protein
MMPGKVPHAGQMPARPEHAGHAAKTREGEQGRGGHAAWMGPSMVACRIVSVIGQEGTRGRREGPGLHPQRSQNLSRGGAWGGVPFA